METTATQDALSESDLDDDPLEQVEQRLSKVEELARMQTMSLLQGGTKK